MSCNGCDHIFFVHLQALSSQERSKILQDIADALEANEKAILAENEADIVAAQQAGYEKSLISRLALKQGKVSVCLVTQLSLNDHVPF